MNESSHSHRAFWSLVTVVHRNVGEQGWEVVVGKLQIVWRNPNPVKHINRWYANPMSATIGAVRYVIEELVGDGTSIYWTVKTSLEVVSSERAA